jgi:outer membrane protein OmpA-like peptidoglycan-associated protein
VETVVGYGDPSGSTAHNLVLAGQRAKSVAAALTALADAHDHITVTVGGAGAGPAKPGQVTVHIEWVM